MSLNVNFKDGRPENLSHEDEYYAGIILMLAGVSEVNDSTIPIIINRMILDAALTGTIHNSVGYLTDKLSAAKGMKANVTDESTQQFIRRKLKFNTQLFDIPKKTKKAK